MDYISPVDDFDILTYRGCEFANLRTASASKFIPLSVGTPELLPTNTERIYRRFKTKIHVI
jgi:hypothetical protein